MNKIINDITIEKAKDFLSYFRLSDDRWDCKDSDRVGLDGIWAFRGQGDSSYKLMPSVWRDGSVYRDKLYAQICKNHSYINDLNKLNGDYYNFDIANFGLNISNYHNVYTLFKEIYLEMILIQNFVDIANRASLQIASCEPFGIDFANHVKSHESIQHYCHSGLYELCNYIAYTNSYMNNAGTSQHTQRGCYPYLTLQKYDKYSIAYAQHHGMPTRYLDFTYNPLKAMYFSAISANDSNEISIYAVKNNFLHNFPSAFSAVSEHIEFVDNFRTYSFAFLKAQEGLFINFSDANYYFYEKGGWPDLESYLSFIFEKVISLEPDFAASNISPNFIKVNLKGESEIKNVLRLLDREGINEVTVKPSYDSIYPYILNKYGI